MKINFLIQIKNSDGTLHDEIDFFDFCNFNAKNTNELLNSLSEIIKQVDVSSKKIDITLGIELQNPCETSYDLRSKIKNNKIEPEKLSSRETEVLNLIMQGYTNKQISEMLFISFETARSHRKNILKKTGQKNTAVLVNYYHQTFFNNQSHIH